MASGRPSGYFRDKIKIMGVTNELPPKRDVAIALLEASSVYVHLDPRAAGVMVPAWFKKQPQLVLQVGLNMPVPIPDLDVGEEALSCTLSFNRRPEYCRIPWSAVYGLVGEDGRGMIWPEDVPPEVAAQAQGRAAAPKEQRRLRAVPEADAEAARAPEASETAAEPVASKADVPPGEGAKAGAKARGASAKLRASTNGKRAQGEAAPQATGPQAAGEAPAAAPEAAPSEDAEAGRDTAATGRAKRELPPYLRVVK